MKRGIFMAETPDLNQITNTAANINARTPGFLAGQDAKTNDFLGRFKGLLGSQETTSAMAERMGGELGLPQLRGNATMLRNTLTNLPSTYSAASRGFDVNNNQLQRIIGQKTSELAPAVETAERSLSSAEQNLDTRMGYTQRDQDRQLIPYQTEQSFLSDRLARETTLYSQDNERELDALLQKMSLGVTLSEGEKNRAQELAINEKNYANELEKIKETAKYSSTGTDNTKRFITLSDGATLYDTQTGQVVSENNKNFKASAGGGGSDWY